MEEFFITTDGMRLHAKLERPEGVERGPLAIVLHGLTGNMEEHHIVAAAQAFVEVGVAALRVELYGHGQSDGDFAEHTLYKWINNVLAVIDYTKQLDFVSELYLCGHSQGGLTAMLVAGMCPDLIAALIPLSPALVIVDGARTGHMLNMSFDPNHIPDRLEFKDVHLNGTYLRGAQTLNVDDAIARYPGPVLMVHGTADQAVPVHYSKDAAPKYSDARLVLLEDDDHGYHAHLDQALVAIRNFVQGL